MTHLYNISSTYLSSTQHMYVAFLCHKACFQPIRAKFAIACPNRPESQLIFFLFWVLVGNIVNQASRPLIHV